MRLLALSGSLRAASTNTAALEALSRLAPASVEVTIYRDMPALPYFNADDDAETTPQPVAALRGLVGSSDGLFIAAPEYAHGVPGALKNALDWLVASPRFPAKPVALINTAPRASHAQSALREILATMSARLVPEAFVVLPLTGQDVDAERTAGDPALARALRAGLDCFIHAIRGDAG